MKFLASIIASLLLLIALPACVSSGTIPVYNVVSDFGADPTGATISSIAFQKAQAAAQAAPGKIFVPCGNYRADGINITSQFGGWLGAGKGCVVVRATAPGNTIFTATNTFLVSITEMALGGVGGIVQTGGALIFMVGSHACDLSNLELVDGYHGIILDHSTNCRVQFNKMFQFYGPDMILSQNGGAAHIDSNQLDTSSYGPTPYVHGTPVTVWAPSHAYAAGAVAIANNAYFIAGNAGTSSVIGPAVSPFGTAIPDGTVNWYFLCASNHHPISLASGGNSNYVRFNDIDGPNAGAISISGSSTNLIFGNTLSNGLRSAIDIASGNDNKISTNMVQNFPYQGIAEGSSSIVGSIIAHNSIANIGSTKIVQLGSGGIYSPNVLH